MVLHGRPSVMLRLEKALGYDKDWKIFVKD